ncbi:hypothetical protein DVH24_036820 [Malus domestica]|uniref:Uncharacterized protein n=1 Tax=Malus domestica TaxID=3750 RepID=A0A498IHB6_MALDO|nr:hypothetical protein DVH24_036820 [Malus domestica]
MDDDIQKAASIENKVKVHTYGYEVSRMLLDLETTVAEVLTNQELHVTVYQQGVLSLNIIMVSEYTTKTSAEQICMIPWQI